jgi:hypothetical protein
VFSAGPRDTKVDELFGDGVFCGFVPCRDAISRSVNCLNEFDSEFSVSCGAAVVESWLVSQLFENCYG